MMEEKPLITFLLICYNQEKYIREALQGAFSQTYSPLEIVISDDASTDRTFEIIEEEVNKYRGEHRILVNRNNNNVGLVGNFNRAIAISNGEIIVAAAGDDISFEERVEVIYSKLVELGKSVVGVFSDGIMIHDNGEELGAYVAPTRYLDNIDGFLRHSGKISGASHAFRKNIYDIFGPLDENLIGEDRSMAIRELLIGKIHHISEPLFKYRVGVGVSSSNPPAVGWHVDVIVKQHEKDISLIGNKSAKRSLNVYRDREKYLADLYGSDFSIAVYIKYLFNKNIDILWASKFFIGNRYKKLYTLYKKYVYKYYKL